MNVSLMLKNIKFLTYQLNLKNKKPRLQVMFQVTFVILPVVLF